MQRELAFWVALVLCGTTGCSTSSARLSDRPPQDAEAASARYQRLAAETTPSTWRAGAKWAFIALDKRDAIVESFVFQVTDTPQTTCSAGDWKKLEVVEGDATRLAEPAYTVEGRSLLILLSTAFCDAEPTYRGELSDKGFIGSHEFSHLLGREVYGKVYGVSVGATP